MGGRTRSYPNQEAPQKPSTSSRYIIKYHCNPIQSNQEAPQKPSTWSSYIIKCDAAASLNSCCMQMMCGAGVYLITCRQWGGWCAGHMASRLNGELPEFHTRNDYQRSEMLYNMIRSMRRTSILVGVSNSSISIWIVR